MNFRRFAAGLSAAAVAGSLLATSAMTAFADDDSVTIYGEAGISFQVLDTYEYRDFVGTNIMSGLLKGDDNKSLVYDVTCYDVNITGNGSYEVSLVGWWPGMAEGWEESEMGWISLSTTIEGKKDGDDFLFVDYPEASIKIDSYSQDGIEFDMSAEEILLEDGGTRTIGEGDDKVMNKTTMLKIVNKYGDVDHRGVDEYKYVTWQTTEPVVIKFTVSGLPTDKVEDYENEVIEYKSGNGSPEEGDEPAESEAPTESEDPADSEAPAESEAPADDTSDDKSGETAGDADSTPAKTDSSSKADDEGSNLPLYLGIGGGVVVLGAVVAIVIKAKK